MESAFFYDLNIPLIQSLIYKPLVSMQSPLQI